MVKKNKLKKTFCIAVIVLVTVLVLLVIGFVLDVFTSIFRYADNVFLTYYNDNEVSGFLSAKYKEKIYFFSNELDGVNGIYSMDIDGSDTELLIECPNVRRITVNEDGIYFVGLYKTYNKTKYTENTRNGIFYSKDFKMVEHIAPELLSVYDFYLFDDEFLSVSERYEGRWRNEGTSYLIQNGEILRPTEDEIQLHEIYNKDQNMILLSIKQYQNIPLYFVSSSGFPLGSEEGYLHYGESAFISDITGTNVSYNMVGHYNARYISKSNEVVSAYRNDGEIYVFDLNGYKLNKIISLGLEGLDKEEYHYKYTITGYKEDNIYVKADVYEGRYLRQIKYFGSVLKFRTAW